ncbi:membrane protein YqaA with SNARE-associated domain [Sphingomonas sp. F9_3S_D5_B_2]
MEQHLLLFLIVFGVNLLPAFGPPTWSILVVYRLNSDIQTWVLVLIGATAAAAGRYVLGTAFWHLRSKLSEKTRKNLEAAHEALERRKRNTVIALGLFALSPLPSAQLFEASGLAGVRLLGFTAAFFVGRLISYSVYAYTAERISETSMGDALRGGFSNPWLIGLQVGLIILLVLMARINWARLLGGGKSGGAS